MGNVVNLRRVRKARARAAADAQAATNRALHGRTKAQKRADDAAAERLARSVDGAELDR